MTEDRKDGLIKNFLFEESIKIEDLKGVEVQEVIYLIFTAQGMKNGGNCKEIDFDSKITMFINSIIEKIIEGDEFYIAYNHITKYPHIDNLKRIWIFSKEEYAKEAKDHFKKTNLMLEAKKLDNYNLIKEIAESRRFGVVGVTIDMGQYTIDIELDNIVPPIDYSGFEEKDIPLMNETLSFSMIKYFQELWNEDLKYRGKMQVLMILEAEMIKLIGTSKYLIPLKYKDNNKSHEDLNNIIFLEVLDKDENSLIPIFTDWVEFRKRYGEDVFGAVVSYEEALKIAKDRELILNPDGLKVHIDAMNKAKINNFLKSIENKKVKLEEKEEVSHIKIIEPKVYPEELIEKVTEYMKKNKNVKRAYLRYVIKEDKENYLMIVDTERNKDAIFNDIKEIAKDYLKESFLEITEMVSFRESLENIKPFYKKRKLGMF